MISKNFEQCSVYKKCNGCQLQNMTYIEQLRWKENGVRKLFGKLCKVEHIIGADNPTHYRNKVQAVFRTTKDNKLISGIYQSERQGILAFDKCMVQDIEANKIIVTIRQIMDKYNIKPSDSKNRSGFVKHVLIRCGKKSGEYMVVLVANSLDFPKEDNFVKRLLSAHPMIKTIVLCQNDEDKLLLSDKQRNLFGDGYIYDELCGYKFRISPQSFYQINSEQTEKLYNTVIRLANLDKDETVLDAYCGIGTIGICASSCCNKIIGVESNIKAIIDAQVNAEINGIDNISFVTMDAGEYLSSNCNEKIDTAIIDPPRAGCSKQFLDALVKFGIKNLVYISCNPETQLRDCKYLMKSGYEIKQCHPVDLFPFSRHIENIVKLNLSKRSKE